MDGRLETGWLMRVVQRARQRRGLHLFAANLRIFIGFAMLPAGLKKVLGEPFTDPGSSGPFHDFLHAFHDTGAFYPFVGAVQVLIALLLMTQRLALVGAMLLLPVLTTILVFCWSTAVYPTASVVTLMWLGNAGLLLWELERWRGLVGHGGRGSQVGGYAAPSTLESERVIVGYWARAGLAVFALYGLSALVYGGIYRPRGFERDEPAFWVLVALLVVPVITAVVERRAFRMRTASLS